MDLNQYNVAIIIYTYAKNEQGVIGFNPYYKFSLLGHNPYIEVNSPSDPIDLTYLNGIYKDIATVDNLTLPMGNIFDSNFPTINTKITVFRSNNNSENGLQQSDINNIIFYRYLRNFYCDIYLIIPEISGYESIKSSSLIFHGFIDRNAVTIENDKITINIKSLDVIYNKRICTKKYGDLEVDYSTISESIKNNPIPVILGDWSKNNRNISMEVQCIQKNNLGIQWLDVILCNPGDSGIPFNKYPIKWVTSDGKLKALTSYIAWSTVWQFYPLSPHNSSTDGIVSIFNSERDFFATYVDAAYLRVHGYEEGDKFYITGFKGDVGVSTIDELLNYLLTDTINGINIDPDLIDNVYIYVDFDPLPIIRAYFHDEKVIFDLIIEILNEFGIKLFWSENGKLRIAQIAYKCGQSINDTRVINLDSTYFYSFTETTNSFNENFDGLSINYLYNPGEDNYLKKLTFGRKYGNIKQLYFKYNYTEIGIGNFLIPLSNLMRKKLSTYTLSIDINEIDNTQLGGLVTIMYLKEIYNCQVISKTFDFTTGKLNLILLRYFNDPEDNYHGLWCDEISNAVPPEYGDGIVPQVKGLATDIQKRRLSFWNDDDDELNDGEVDDMAWFYELAGWNRD